MSDEVVSVEARTPSMRRPIPGVAAGSTLLIVFQMIDTALAPEISVAAARARRERRGEAFTVCPVRRLVSVSARVPR